MKNFEPNRAFNTEVAAALGIYQAILIQQIRYWQEKSTRQLPQSKDMGLVTHDLTVSGNNATSLLPHYTWLHHWVVGSTHLTNTFTH